MKKTSMFRIVFLVFLLAGLAVSVPANANPIYFDGAYDETNTYDWVTAYLTYSGGGTTTLTINIYNTSDDLSAITQIGIGLGTGITLEDVADGGWQLLAYVTDQPMDPFDENAEPVIGSTQVDITSHWGLGSFTGGGLSFDLVPNTNHGVQYGLVNPESIGVSGENLYATMATLIITLETKTWGSVIDDWGLKFQNISPNGNPSLDGDLSGSSVGTPVPEPGTLILIGSGLMGLASVRLRRKSRK